MLELLFEEILDLCEGSGNSAKLSLLMFSLSADAVLENVVKIGFLELYGAIGCSDEMVAFLTGESVMKVDGCGVGMETFILLSKRTLGGVLLP